jgi:hypothetical protein
MNGGGGGTEGLTDADGLMLAEGTVGDGEGDSDFFLCS